ncbi:MAG: S8 family serine peptidase [Candidatus Thermoplasmatota archaeon]|nr:S8 family serine peptidase [Candidatus Thermoplasmatota archaeon]
MRYSLFALGILLMLLPSSVALDRVHEEVNPSAFQRNEVEEPLLALPWWERTAMDKDRNGIADHMEDRPSSGDPLDIIVSFSRKVTDRDMDALWGAGFIVGSRIDPIDAVTLFDVPSTRLGNILGIPGVVFVEPLGVPVLFSDIATPTVRARGSKMYSPLTAWDLGYLGRGVSIAIIDTGIDDEHPSLRGKFLGGVDMTKPDNLQLIYPQDGTYDPDDIQGHGSTCAGIATGTGAPTGDYMGSAPEARLVDIRIGTKIGYAPGEFWVGAQNDPHLKDGTLRGIDWGISNIDKEWSGAGSDYAGIDILSLSWGIDIGTDSDGTDAYSRLLDTAVERGAIVVNAAGNDGPSNTGFNGLSASSRAIIVAATLDNNTLEHDDDTIAVYSSRGPRTDNGDGDPYDELKPDIAAPGTYINNLQPHTNRFIGDASGNGYGNRGSGTSYATPLVAGVIALMLEANPALEGENDLVKEILRYTAHRKGDPTYPELDPFWERDHGWGTVDAYSAVELSLLVEDPSIIDPRLQSHILSPAITNITDPVIAFNASDRITIEGLGWSRGGDFEGTEYRIDDGEWRSVTYQNGSTFHPFRIDLPRSEPGTYRIWVRSIGGDMESLPDWIDIEILDDGTGPEGEIGSTILITLLLAAIAAVGAGVFVMGKRIISKRRTG